MTMDELRAEALQRKRKPPEQQATSPAPKRPVAIDSPDRLLSQQASQLAINCPVTARSPLDELDAPFALRFALAAEAAAGTAQPERYAAERDAYVGASDEEDAAAAAVNALRRRERRAPLSFGERPRLGRVRMHSAVADVSNPGAQLVPQVLEYGATLAHRVFGDRLLRVRFTQAARDDGDSHSRSSEQRGRDALMRHGFELCGRSYRYFVAKEEQVWFIAVASANAHAPRGGVDGRRGERRAARRLWFRRDRREVRRTTRPRLLADAPRARHPPLRRQGTGALERHEPRARGNGARLRGRRHRRRARPVRRSTGPTAAASSRSTSRGASRSAPTATPSERTTAAARSSRRSRCRRAVVAPERGQRHAGHLRPAAGRRDRAAPVDDQGGGAGGHRLLGARGDSHLRHVGRRQERQGAGVAARARRRPRETLLQLQKRAADELKATFAPVLADAVKPDDVDRALAPAPPVAVVLRAIDRRPPAQRVDDGRGDLRLSLVATVAGAAAPRHDVGRGNDGYLEARLPGDR